MLQRGRKSTANLATPGATGRRPHLTPPASLTTEEKKLFSELVGSCDSNHFRKSDLPLLISYVQATLMAQTAVHDPSQIARWEKAVKVQATLATRLRLAQARSDPKSVARQDRDGMQPTPWETQTEFAERLRTARYEEGDEE